MKQRFYTKPTLFAALALMLAPLIAACGESAPSTPNTGKSQVEKADKAGFSTAIFAAGCFWCVEEAFDPIPGVVETTSGYTGGTLENPSYEQVSAGGTGHTEALRVRYDAEKVSYQKLLDVFWRNVDPTDGGGQFCDRGSQYRSGIFYRNEQQRSQAAASKNALQDNPAAPSPIVTEITQAGEFYPAEAYHQNYYRENPIRYKFYKSACGRANRLEELWVAK